MRKEQTLAGKILLIKPYYSFIVVSLSLGRCLFCERVGKCFPRFGLVGAYRRFQKYLANYKLSNLKKVVSNIQG